MFKYTFNAFKVLNGWGFEFMAYRDRMGIRYSCDGWSHEMAAEFVRHLNVRYLALPGVQS